MNDDIKNLLCFLLVILVGVGFLSLLCLSSESKTDNVEVENVPVFHSNPDGTIDTYIYPVIH
jgi:hypothetical protein